MQINELSDRELTTFIKNYEAVGKTVGGKFSVAELSLEKLRRTKSPFPTVRTAQTIIDLARASSDGLVSYKEVWTIFRPDKIWTGNAPRAEIAKALGAVIAYCVDNKFPIVTTLVVRADSRKHSEEAIDNIYNEAKALGVDVGLDPGAFVKEQQEAARKLVLGETNDN